MENKNLVVQSLDTLPSPAEFARVEDRNVPAVLVGALRSWPAYSLWDPSKGGLQRLNQLAGSAMVQAMATDSGSNFYGDIRGHERVPIRFESFLNLADSSECVGARVEKESCKSDLDMECKVDRLALEEPRDLQLYLAQAGIYRQDSVSIPPLSSLKGDIEIPSFLQYPVSAINLWMSVNGSRSSTHYDPYHNLLCVVSGRKEVKLWPPSSAPSLYPLPIHGEASNHSGVDFVNPDLTKFPRFDLSMRGCQVVTLHAGDGLFLPEGWYHQVDSQRLTIAVNLWWQSGVSSKLGSHMDAYLLRRVLANLVDVEKEQIISEYTKLSSENARIGSKQCEDSRKPILTVQHECGPKEKPCEALTSSVSKDDICTTREDGRCETDKSADTEESQEKSENTLLKSASRSKPKSRRHRRHSNRRTQVTYNSNPDGPISRSKLETGVVNRDALCEPEDYHNGTFSEDLGDATVDSVEGLHYKSITLENLTISETQALRTLVLSVSNPSRCTVEHESVIGVSEQRHIDIYGDGDSTAQIFSSLSPQSLQRALLVMAADFPRTFEALVLYNLSPIAAEVLTRKFEEMDSMPELDIPQQAFYTHIYSVFDNPHQAMTSLIDGKEGFAAMALNRVMDKYLGLYCTPLER